MNHKTPFSRRSFVKLGMAGIGALSLPQIVPSRVFGANNRLNVAILGDYGRMRQRYGRFVAPVIGGICYGCFMKIPSAIETAENRDDSLHRCENCGMFLYWVEK